MTKQAEEILVMFNRMAPLSIEANSTPLMNG